MYMYKYVYNIITMKAQSKTREKVLSFLNKIDYTTKEGRETGVKP